jgi:hypothetical protein
LAFDNIGPNCILVFSLLDTFESAYAVATSKPFTDVLAFTGAIAALVSGVFWYVAAKQTLIPHVSPLMGHIINLYNFWAGELSAVSGVCIAMSLGLKRE